MAETYKFQAEISQLMGLIINTFYSHKEIFLREVVSNASDALDKIRYQSLTDPSVLDSDASLKIQIIPRVEDKVLIIRDSGIGMTKADLANNLGIIAKSGTKGFMEALDSGADMSLIGQFGVGFYSVFLVAETVEVYSKHNEDACHVWTSSAGGSFTISPADRPDLPRGTEIVLHLKDGCEEFLQAQRIRDIIKAHSQFIGFPIELYTTRKEDYEEEITEPEKPAESKPEGEAHDGAEDTPAEDGEAAEASASEEEDEAHPRTRKLTRDVPEWERLNSESAIWTRKPGTVTHEEYASFYKNLTGEWEDHLAVKHFHVEGHVDFKGMLFIPRRAPFDMFEARKKKVGVKLYVRKVFITDECTDLLPEWLSFVKGVVDSDDLPLNISRETLQKNTVIQNMRTVIIMKVIELLAELAAGKYQEGPTPPKPEDTPEGEDGDEAADDAEEKSIQLWKTFYEHFAKNLKLGVHEDATNRERLAGLLRFYSTKSGQEMTSLDEYIDRMAEHQNNIYYITGESRRHCETSPFLERLREKGFEVIFMDQAIDEYAVSTLREYKGKKLQCITKDGLELEESSEEKQRREEDQAGFARLIDFIKDVLGDRVENVKLGYRLTETPCVLTTSEWGWSAQMQRIMKAQALRDDSMTSVMSGKATMEINPTSRLMRTLRQKLEDDPEDATLRSSIILLFETSQISSGFSLEDISSYVRRIYAMMSAGMAGDEDDEMPGLTDATAAHVDGEGVAEAEADAPVAAPVADADNLEAID